MPRPKKENSEAPPKKRSRTGCWPCKGRKVKCGEEKPICTNCSKSGETCDYSIRLNWGGRSRKDQGGTPEAVAGVTVVNNPNLSWHYKSSNGNGNDHVFSRQHIATAAPRPPSSHPSDLPTPEPTPSSESTMLDPRLRPAQSSFPEFQPSYNFPAYPPSLISQHSTNSNERSPPTSVPIGDEFNWSPQHSAKRVKLNANSSPQLGQPSPVFAIPQYPAHLDQSPSSTNQFTPHSITSIVNTPATPGSSINSGSPFPTQQPPLQVQDPPDLRRLSVKSLLSEPSDEPERPRFTRVESIGSRTYGYDHGLPDLDIPRNDDNNAVLPKSPDLRRASAAVSEVSTSSGEIDAKLIAFEPGGYYAQPVAVKIPRILEPLPPELHDNPMNLLYFHHFINHTGRILVPHDCPENPFRGVLPQMAVRNQHLLHLMLAFSASHRARLLGHDEPANRIAAWMADVLPALRQALAEPTSPGGTDPSDPSSLAPLATAIMLASLDILSPSTFAVAISWQQHLQVARRMIILKGGLDHLAQKADGARDKAIFFLSRWFAYLDVLGSLSGSQHEQPLYGAYLEDGGGLWLVNRGNEETYQIDCFFGFSGKCISLLAQVAELASQCDQQRIDSVTKQVRADWQAPEQVKRDTEDLKTRLRESATNSNYYRGCTHQDPSSPPSPGKKTEQDIQEIYATNEAYHWAGHIHLSRRVLCIPSTDPEVQDCVQKITDSLQKVRRGSSAESCLLFPMFTAGCEAQTREARELFIDRMKAVEGWGMHNVTRARVLMEEVWRTGKPWETLVTGDEFFG